MCQSKYSSVEMTVTVRGARECKISLRRRRSHVRNHVGSAGEQGSVSDTWVTFYTDDIGNTFGPKGFARGSSLQVSSSKYPRS